MATQRIGNNRITDGEVTGPKLGINSIGANNFTSAANTYITGAASSNPTVTAAFNHANAVFLQSNNNVGVDLTQNTSIASSFVHANAAFLSSNTYALTNNGVNTTQNASVAAAFTRANNSLNANTGGVVGGATTFSGNLTVVGDTSITGNLFVSGNTVSISSGSIVANDSMIILGINNYTADIVDIGFAGHYNDGTNAHSGLIRDTGTKEWHLFKGYTPEIGSTNNINLADGSYAVDTLNANLKAPANVSVKGIDLLVYSNTMFNTANAAFVRANNALDANNGGTVAGAVVYRGANSSLSFDAAPLAVRANLNIQSVTETANIVSTAIGGNTILYLANNSSYYFAANPTANITFDLRANSQSGGTLDNYLTTGQMISVGIMLSQGATAYRANLFIDGVLQTANTRWSGNVNPAFGGTANGIDVYSFSVLKRGANSYIILASNTAFANGATNVY
jgi:hypothetical protein